MAGRHARSREGLVVENADYVAALLRLHRGFYLRLAADPGALAYVAELESDWRDGINWALAQCNERGGWSQAEIGAIYGHSQQAVGKRVAAGRLVRDRLERAAGVVALRDLRVARHRAARIPDVHAGRKERAAYDRKASA